MLRHARKSARVCTRAKFGNLAIFAILRKCTLVPPSVQICAKKCTNRPKSGVFGPKKHTFFLKTVFFWLLSTSIAPGKKHAQGVLSAWKKPANLYSTKCRIFGPPPPRAQHRGGTPPSRRPVFDPVEYRRPAGARFPEAATHVAQKIIFIKIKIIFFLMMG